MEFIGTVIKAFPMQEGHIGDKGNERKWVSQQFLIEKYNKIKPDVILVTQRNNIISEQPLKVGNTVKIQINAVVTEWNGKPYPYLYCWQVETLHKP